MTGVGGRGVEFEGWGCAAGAWHIVITQICVPVLIIGSLFWGAVFHFCAFYLSSAFSVASLSRSHKNSQINTRLFAHLATLGPPPQAL